MNWANTLSVRPTHHKCPKDAATSRVVERWPLHRLVSPLRSSEFTRTSVE